jgi:hypothetical protein
MRFSKRLQRYLLKLLLPLIVVLFILFSPALLLFSLVRHSIYLRRLHAASSKFVCGCGSVLGKESVRLADEVWHSHVQDLHRKHPGVKFRLCRTVHAICVNCGKTYRFLEKDRTFAEVVSPPLGETSGTQARENNTAS